MIEQLEREFHDPGWVYDPETQTVRQRRIRGMATPGSDEERAVLDRIRELRDQEELNLLPKSERRRRRHWRR